MTQKILTDDVCFIEAKNHFLLYFCNMNIFCNFYNTSRLTINILGLKLEDLLDNNKPTSPLVYSNSAPLQQLIGMLFWFFFHSENKSR